eukprot:scaffold42240_cov60-Attheya_sp.AAC.1
MKLLLSSALLAVLAANSASAAFVAPSKLVTGATATTTTSTQVQARGDGYGELLDDVTQAVGNTPMIKINEKLCPPGRTIYAKCEFFNPLSSVKDRLAVSIIETAEREGKLKPGDTVIEATSGNTGIAVAMVCAQR